MKISNFCALIVVGLSLAACKQKEVVETTYEQESPVWVMSDDSVELGTSDFETFDITPDYSDLAERVLCDTARGEYVENTKFDDVVSIRFDGQKASVEGDNADLKVQTKGAHVTLTAANKVRVELSGTTTDGSLKVVGDKKVCIVLSGANIKNPQGPALSCLSKKECYLVTDSASVLSDDSLYVKPVKTKKKDEAKAEEEEQQKGCVFAEGKLAISGTGLLKIVGRGADAIHSDKSIFVRRGTKLDIEAYGGDAIQAQNNVRIEGGAINILSTSRGCSAIAAKRLVEIAGGRTVVLSNTPGGKGNKNSRGIKCDSLIHISNAVVRIKEESRGGKGIRCGQDIRIEKSIVDVITLGQDDKATGSKNKGVKAENEVRIDSSRVRIRSLNGYTEALEGRHRIELNNSLVECRSVDDAISVSVGDGDFVVNGGRVYAFGGMDGVDSNGTIHINGGLVFSVTSGKGSRGFDCDTKEFLVTPDAIVVGAGSMISPFTRKLLEHPTFSIDSPNGRQRLIVTAQDSDDCIIALDRPALRYSDLDWNVLASVPECAKVTTIDICSSGKVTPRHTFHGLMLGGKVTEKTVKHTLMLSQPLTCLVGEHPYGSHSANRARQGGAKSKNDSTGNAKGKDSKSGSKGDSKGSGSKGSGSKGDSKSKNDSKSGSKGGDSKGSGSKAGGSKGGTKNDSKPKDDTSKSEASKTHAVTIKTVSEPNE